MKLINSRTKNKGEKSRVERGGSFYKIKKIVFYGKKYIFLNIYINIYI